MLAIYVTSGQKLQGKNVLYARKTSLPETNDLLRKYVLRVVTKDMNNLLDMPTLDHYRR